MSQEKNSNIKIITGAMVLFFCLSPLALYAAAPTLSNISPSSGSTTPETTKTFTCTYSDSDGWANLKETYLLISLASTTLTNVAYLYYDQNSNLLYLRNDANTAWLGGFAPGSSNVIENSRVKLNCSATTVTGVVSSFLVRFSITLKAAFSGKAYNTYLAVKDDTGGSVALTKKGTYTINTKPTLGTITPASGIGQANVRQMFTATYSDPDGWQNIQLANLSINTGTSSLNCFYSYYDQNTNKLYLRNDNDTSWLGGYAPGAANVIENSYSKLECANTTVSANNTTLAVNWAVVLKTPFTGSRSTYLSVKDDANENYPLSPKGSWSIPNTAPQIKRLFPTLGASIPGQVFRFNTTYGDNNTWLNIKEAHFLINTAVAGNNTFYAYYSQDNNRIYLRNDTNTGWQSGYAPGTNKTLENSFARLYCANTTVSGSGNNLSINWAVSFKDNFLGDKKMYLYVRDDAGSTCNWAVKGNWTALDQGTIIGPGGGVLTSSDGLVKLWVGAGALNYTTAIKISTKDTSGYADSAPQGTTLLQVVECQPYNLNFTLPVSIEYKLPQAEIPGTPVELGLYDALQDKIISTGQTSTVPEDGVTLTFSLQHFSTYAALMNLVPASIPIGSGVKIPLPDMLTGAFSQSIPISVAPGRKGMQPSLSLAYRSSSPNSWVGMGYSLNPGYIVRSTRLGPPGYTDNDTFYFVSDAGTTELVRLVDNLYQAKIESSFTKFYKESDDTWRVVGKDGSTLRFGQSSDSKETSAQGTFSWYVTKAQDTSGNYIEYHYSKDQGKSYLSCIDYTGHDSGLPASHSVEFILEGRDDIVSSYTSNARIATAKRLKEIQVKANQILVWKYALEYAYSNDTKRSLLTTVTQFASDGLSLPRQRLRYQEVK